MHYIILYYIILFRITYYHIMSYNIILRFIILYYIILYHGILSLLFISSPHFSYDTGCPRTAHLTWSFPYSPSRTLLPIQVLKGILKNMPDMGTPDLISAPLMAREAGIQSHISQVRNCSLKWEKEMGWLAIIRYSDRDGERKSEIVLLRNSCSERWTERERESERERERKK